MNKFVIKFSGVVAAMALMVTAMNVNSACFLLYNQPEIPEGAKSLRRF
jgi:cyclic lactone autoinducer peptide